jgi:homoserine dehydrogenase
LLANNLCKRSILPAHHRARQPGVLAKIAAILSEHGISIESVIQKGRRENEPVAALQEIDSLDTVAAPTVRIRMLGEE